MLYGFDSDDQDQATAALLVYAVWRSRDANRLKITPEIWGQVERFVKGAAKRSKTPGEFLERLKPRLMCETLRPKAMDVGVLGADPALFVRGGEVVVEAGDGGRQFLTRVLADCHPARMLRLLYTETSWIILLVRDRLERERPIESKVRAILEED